MADRSPLKPHPFRGLPTNLSDESLRSCLKRLVWRDFVPPRICFLAGRGHIGGRDPPDEGFAGAARPPHPHISNSL